MAKYRVVTDKTIVQCTSLKGFDKKMNPKTGHTDSTKVNSVYQFKNKKWKRIPKSKFFKGGD